MHKKSLSLNILLFNVQLYQTEKLKGKMMMIIIRDVINEKLMSVK